MPSPLNTSLRLAAGAPAWLIFILAAIAVAATAVVAGHRHGAAEAAEAAAVPDTNGQATTAGRAAIAHRSDRDVASRSADRTAVSRPGMHDRSRRMRVIASPAPLRREPVGPVASSDAAQTAASALASSSNIPGQCLEWSREQADIPSKYPDATTAWEHATGRRPGDTDPPRGAAVYWTGGSSGHGHIAISLGNGLVRSSDADGTGQVGTVPIRYFDREWNLHYVGWANSINGYTIPGVASA